MAATLALALPAPLRGALPWLGSCGCDCCGLEAAAALRISCGCGCAHWLRRTFWPTLLSSLAQPVCWPCDAGSQSEPGAVRWGPRHASLRLRHGCLGKAGVAVAAPGAPGMMDGKVRWLLRVTVCLSLGAGAGEGRRVEVSLAAGARRLGSEFFRFSPPWQQPVGSGDLALPLRWSLLHGAVAGGAATPWTLLV